MSSTVPGAIAWPFITFMAIIVVARYRWFNNNLYGRYLNNTLALALLAQLLHEHLVQDTLSMAPADAQQLYGAVVGFVGTEFIGFTLLWTGLSAAKTRKKHRYYRLAALVLCAAYLICGTGARALGEPLEVAGGWDRVAAWTFGMTMLLVLAVHLVWRSVLELRTVAQRRERLIAISTLLLGALLALTCLQDMGLPIADQLGWTNTADYRLRFHRSINFYTAAGVCMIAAVPCLMKLLGCLGLDPISRSWRKLQPLRQSMRTAVPECAFDLDIDDHRHLKTTLQLHQTVVEIRDAILQLRPYCREMPRHHLVGFLGKANTVPAREHDAAIEALHLAQAVRAKAAGATPEPREVALIGVSRATNLEEEVTGLLKLAKWWPAAYATSEHTTVSGLDTMKVSPSV
ncbi:hypothetical protein MHAE_05637 [Mycobacterium haemophilum DSM 44634]|uniref:DUF6545 domain-containing protein n=1 Tax=Mycobacterium haemophilum TaxID=29311 RepID=UPI00065519E9|nr:DUF6545 domain-containing protein [Mycobacterium haemophilum]MCV7339854.1 hypothetical protein [Mycobacterium haemophilum DSM 44634]